MMSVWEFVGGPSGEDLCKLAALPDKLVSSLSPSGLLDVWVYLSAAMSRRVTIAPTTPV